MWHARNADPAERRLDLHVRAALGRSLLRPGCRGAHIGYGKRGAHRPLAVGLPFRTGLWSWPIRVRDYGHSSRRCGGIRFGVPGAPPVGVVCRPGRRRVGRERHPLPGQRVRRPHQAPLDRRARSKRHGLPSPPRLLLAWSGGPAASRGAVAQRTILLQRRAQGRTGGRGRRCVARHPRNCARSCLAGVGCARAQARCGQALVLLRACLQDLS
mmetsp:Transcript_66283/g.173784  ORF Transcript_66283/g.173784 Transcript_66283/m.173784 type:complete len:213 (-) Transcript_66283:44-682(-)